MKEEPINNNIFTIKDESGKTIECEILFLFDSPETAKSYIIYTDNTKTESGELKVYANIYDKNGGKELLPIETEEEWNTIEAILAKLEDSEEQK